jgi:tRNA-2-methylthio-N6-dimethylallyladenosine synthase
MRFHYVSLAHVAATFCTLLPYYIGPQYIPYLASIIDQIRTGRQLVATAPNLMAEMDWSTPPIRGHDVRGFVNVIFGCNEHCTYCVVPATRGMEMSRTMESIWHEVKSLRDNGHKEVTLLGQNIDAYGRDMNPKRSFAELLEYLDRQLGGNNADMRLRYVRFFRKCLFVSGQLTKTQSITHGTPGHIPSPLLFGPRH